MASQSIVLMTVALGGGVGCAARIAVRDVLASRGVASSTAILAVNLAGAAVAGAVAGSAADPGSIIRISAVAVLSGWTTYSAFSSDLLAAFRGGRTARAATLWIGTIVATPAVAVCAARLVSGDAR